MANDPSVNGMFDAGAARLRTLPPSANFLREIAQCLYQDSQRRGDPDWLGQSLIYVPNRRSARYLASAFFDVSGGKAMLLPDIRALGDLESDDAPPSAEAALADLPPAIDPAQRIGQLTRLVLAYFHAQQFELPVPSALSAARELARLLDQAALSGNVDLSELETLSLDAGLAAHWERSAKFLTIITQQWPAKLDDAQAMDPYARRYAAAEALVGFWRANPPETPVLIAGSTGATPASRLLIEAVMQLPAGLVVLPGLDKKMVPDVWARLPDARSHPQFALAQTLGALGIDRADVADWPGLTLKASAAARERIVHEALAPAQDTADWTYRLDNINGDQSPDQFVRSALDGLDLIDVYDEAEEAEIAALLLRSALEVPGKTAALVTADASLGQHVSELLKRWDIDILPSSGQPLLQTAAGSFAGLVLDWLLDPGDPVCLLAMLRHPYCRLDSGAVDALDRSVLRGVRVWDDLASLKGRIAQLKAGGAVYRQPPEADLVAAAGVVEDVIAALGRAGWAYDQADTEDGGVTGADWWPLCIAVMTELADPPAPWLGDDGRALSACLEGLAVISAELGPQAPSVFVDLFSAEAAMVAISSAAGHPALSIWGPLEARLQTADHIILAGLNEGVWPAQPPADSFLPRPIRAKLNLSDPDERVGLSAHDFSQLACAPNVTLLCAGRREDKPVPASRWIWRLRMLARGALGEAGAEAAFAPAPDQDPRVWKAALHSVPQAAPPYPIQPQPRPPLDARPDALSVTRIETLIRDPYSIYCQYVLGLYKLDPLNMPVDVRARGTAIHAALERFELEVATADADADKLLALLEEELLAGGETEADLTALREVRRGVAEAFINWRQDIAHQISGAALTEITGAAQFDIGGRMFTLRGTADRIEKRVDGSVAILDFKSGKPPTEAQVRSGLSPQMPLQGLIAQQGGYEGLGKNPSISALTYLQFGTKFDVREIGAPGKSNELPVEDIIADAKEGLIRLLTQFADPDHPYLSAPIPERVSYASDYDRLARRDEWTGIKQFD